MHRRWQRTRDLSLRALVLGEPGCGKTTRIARWVKKLEQFKYYNTPWVDSIFVFDRICEREWERWPVVRGLSDFWGACVEYEDEDGYIQRELPRCVVWRCGVEPHWYEPALRLAVDQGDVLIVFSEAADWFKNHTRDWPVRQIREDGTMLEHLLRAGRHIRDANGQVCPIHWIADTQYTMDCSPLLRNTASFVATGRMEGSNNLDWVRRNLGRDGRALADQVVELDKHEWLVLRDRLHGAFPDFPCRID